MPLTASEWTTIVALLVVFAVMIWMLPSCGDPECRTAHTKHSVERRVADIERNHATWHGTNRPDPLCALCRSRDKRE